MIDYNERTKGTMMENLGIRYTHVERGHIEATMPVDERTCQIFGILHGGASLALAETVAGLGSLLYCQEDEAPAGIQVSGNHVWAAHKGDTVRAVAEIIHKGRNTHIWNINIYNSVDKLISTARVVNSIIKKR